MKEKLTVKKGIIAASIFILVLTVIIVALNGCENENTVEPVETTTVSATTTEDTYVPKLPYVGMSEDKINSTELGPAYKVVRHNYECIGGNQYLANIYDYKDELGIVIFTARCVRGEVTEVWDTRDAILTYGQDRYTYSRTTSTTKTTTRYSYSAYQYGSNKTTARTSWTSRTTTRKTTAKKYDPYNAKDFYDAEDFYDEHYDDFYDFEDAEDYWYEHGY